jgi:hypothetical protein
MSEANMIVLAGKKADGDINITYESAFLEALQPALASIARYGIKAAGSDAKLVHASVVK